MKTYKILLTLSLFFINTMVISNTTYSHDFTIEESIEKEVETETAKLDDFLHLMGFLESSNNYRKVNTLGYLGKYQFGKNTLETLGYRDIPTEEFVNSPRLQEKIMKKNLEFNKKILQEYIESCEGKCVNNIILTESGMLGAAHLAGAGNVIKFIMEGKNPSDTYGTKLSDYLIKFSYYELNLD